MSDNQRSIASVIQTDRGPIALQVTISHEDMFVSFVAKCAEYANSPVEYLPTLDGQKMAVYGPGIGEQYATVVMFDPRIMQLTAYDMCNCEDYSHDVNHDNHVTYGVTRGFQKAQFVGYVCDNCAATHMSHYLVRNQD